jgi:hypothetical protein
MPLFWTRRIRTAADGATTSSSLTPDHGPQKVSKHDVQGSGIRTTGYQRTRARMVRAGDVTSYLSIKAWCGGQVAVRVSTVSLILATGLSRDQLPGTELAVHANLIAVADTDVDPGDFRFDVPTRSRPAPRR